MRKIKIILIAIILGVGVWSTQTNAHPPYYTGLCGDRAGIVKSLFEKYNETAIGISETHSGDVLEVFSSPNGDTYTIIATKPNGGLTCIVTSGFKLKLRPLPIDNTPSKNGAA